MLGPHRAPHGTAANTELRGPAAAPASRLPRPVPAPSLRAGRGCSTDVRAAAVKDLKTRHAAATPRRRAPRPPYAGPASRKLHPLGRARRRPRPRPGPRPSPRPRRAGLPCFRPRRAGVPVQLGRRAAHPGVWSAPGRGCSEPRRPCGQHHPLRLLRPPPFCRRLAARYAT